MTVQEKPNRTRFVIVALTILVLGLLIANGYLLSTPAQKAQTGFNLKGIVTVLVKDANGKLVSQTKNDTINTNTFDYLACVVFNSPEGCTAALGYGMMVTDVTTVTTTATLPLAFSFPVDPFVMTGMGLSSNIVTTAGCSGLLTTNGLAANNSAESHTVNTNSILLTQSWTFTGGSQSIQSVCLFPFAIKFFTGAAASTVLISSLAFAWETFSPQTLTTGQSITIQWTFSF